jgi:hypothetical protein
MARKRKPGQASPAPAAHRHERTDDAHAFVRDPSEGRGGPVGDDLSERLGEEFVEAATSGEAPDDEKFDESVTEDIGGPFVETSAAEELADDTDETNPEDATREPMPRAVGAETTPGRTLDELNNPGRHGNRR